ncbi:hypothetical protein HDU90_001188, partial [Geranomyces variabilis]
MMGRLGYSIDVVENGAEALDAIKAQGDYDVVLMDMQMRVLNGIAATQSIRGDTNIKKKPYIIALTANASKED